MQGPTSPDQECLPTPLPPSHEPAAAPLQKMHPLPLFDESKWETSGLPGLPGGIRLQHCAFAPGATGRGYRPVSSDQPSVTINVPGYV